MWIYVRTVNTTHLFRCPHHLLTRVDRSRSRSILTGGDRFTAVIVMYMTPLKCVTACILRRKLYWVRDKQKYCAQYEIKAQLCNNITFRKHGTLMLFSHLQQRKASSRLKRSAAGNHTQILLYFIIEKGVDWACEDSNFKAHTCPVHNIKYVVSPGALANVRMRKMAMKAMQPPIATFW